MGLKRRLERLKGKRTGHCNIEVWLYDLDSDTATGPDGERVSAQEANRRTAAADIKIDIRRRP